MSGKNSKTYEKNRICAQSDCQTKLSIYNATSVCFVHSLEYESFVLAEKSFPESFQKGLPYSIGT